MHTGTRNVLLISVLATLIGTGCSDDGGGEAASSFTADDFNYVSPHGAHHHPLSETVTAILAHKEIASLSPAGVGSNSVIDFDDGPPTFPDDMIFPSGFAFDHAASGQIDADPEEEFLAARFSPPAGGEPGLLVAASLERDGTWLERFQLEVGTVSPRAFATGDVDSDGTSEVVVVWDDPQGLWLSVVDDGRQTQRVPAFADYSDLDLDRLELELADLDADGRDEIVLLGNRAPYWEAPYYERRLPVLAVFDDSDAAFELLAQREVQEFAHVDLREGSPAQLVVGDFDRYHEGEEICLTRLVYQSVMAQGSVWLQNESFALVENRKGIRRWRRGAEDRDFPHLVMMTGNFGTPVEHPPAESLTGFQVVAADMDGDGSDELVSAWFTVGAGGSWSCPSSSGSFLVFNLPLDLTAQEIWDRWSVPDPGPARLALDFPTAVDARGQTLERVGSYAVLRAEHDPIASTPSTCSAGWPDFAASSWSLVAGDQDADAMDELHVSGSDGGHRGNPPVFHSTVEADLVGDQFSLRESWHFRNLGPLSPPRLLCADWDSDDFRVRYTGNKQLAVGNPLPLVLMAAPPTKEGISQNYSGSKTSFETSESTEHAYSVTNGVSAGMWAGYEASDPFGVFRAAGKIKFETELARTDTRTVAETVSESYSTAHDEDLIIFHGTLYESYEYEVVGATDPSAIGEIMTIDVPVDAKVYKWTLDSYNSSVALENVIGPEVLGHTIGDPASYMREADAMSLIADDPAQVPGEGYVGWMSGSLTLGQGGGENGVGIELEDLISTAQRVSWKLSAEQEFKAGPFVAGLSVGLFEDHVCEVSVSRLTRYQAEVGDVRNREQYQAWLYDFGLVTYTRGLFSDANNDPDGIEEGMIPFQVETFYTDPIGSGYHSSGNP